MPYASRAPDGGAVKIDKFIAERFQDRQCGWRAINELAIAAAYRKCAFDDQVTLARFDPCFDELRI